MRKIRIIEHISLDGVIQAPGGPDEDRDGDFEHGGWIVPNSDPAVGEATQPGFLCGTVYRKTSGPGRFNVVNMAFWENAGALATALAEQQVGCKRHTPR